MSTDQRPNILIFLVDQVQGQVVAPDHPCQMPNVTQFARQGVTFSQTFGPSPHCCPARATFMSGLYPSRHGVYNNVSTRTAFQKGLNPGVKLFSEYLKEAGYHLAHAGKWHVSDEETPADRGWEELSSYSTHASDRADARIREMGAGWREELARPRELGEVRRPGWTPAQAFGRVLEGDDAIERSPYYKNAILPGVAAIPELAQRGGPWALCVSTDMGPSSAVPKRFLDLYDPDTVPLPESFHDSLADKPRVYQRMQHQLWGQVSMAEVRQTIAQYWALCSLEDYYFGELLGALDASGQADNTLVLFVGDHGDCCFAHGLLHMGIHSFRECYHVPAVVRWPAGLSSPGRTVGEFVSLADFAPTFIELAGREPEERLTGRSLVPFLQDETPDDWRDCWCSQTKGNEVYYTQRIVQTRRHKYVSNWFDFDELYDLESDPNEMVNLASPDRVEQPPLFPEEPGDDRPQVPWPHLSPELEDVRRDMLARMWRFADQEDDIIFNTYPPVALAAYGPRIRLEE